MFKTILMFVLCSLIFSQGMSEIGIREKHIERAYYTNVTVYVTSTKLIKNATIHVNKGYIVSIIPNGKVDKAFPVINLSGKMVYPGFIDVFTQFGLKHYKDDPKQLRKSLNAWNPAIHSEKSWFRHFKRNKKEVSSFLKNGFTVVQSARQNGIFRGKSFVSLVADDLENNIVLKEESSHFLSFNKGTAQGYPWSLMGTIALLRQTLNDADWYQKAERAYSLNPGKAFAEKNASLAALKDIKSNTLFFEAGNLRSVFRANRLLNEYKLPAAILATGKEYSRISELKKIRKTFVVPLVLTEKPDIKTVADEINVELEDLRDWERSATNLMALEKAKISFAISSVKLKKPSDFLKNLKKYIDAGLSKKAAIKALTETPARLLKLNNMIGSLENGRLANFIISDGDLFEGNHKILATVVRGTINEFQDIEAIDMRANYNFAINGMNLSLKMSGKIGKEKLSVKINDKKLKAKKVKLYENEITFSFKADTASLKGSYKFSGRYDEKGKFFSGYILDDNLEREFIKISKVSDLEKKKKKDDKKKENKSLLSKISYPMLGFGEVSKKRVETVLYKNFTIWTSEKNFELKNTDLLIEDGKIEKIGKNLSAPSKAKVIDGKGKYLTTGIIDQHSHIAIEGGFNEGHSISAEVTVADVVNAEDISIYRQLAGGVTTSQLLHGSADPIGGQSQIIKLRWGLDSEGIKFKKAAQNIKFALGENVKRSRSSRNTRYPNTRMGVETIMRDAFQAAIEYRDEWRKYRDLGSSERKRTIPPRKDLQKDVLLDILEGRTFVHCHSYVQSEIIMLMRLAEEFGFKVHTFTHILEGYKVADEMKKHGAMASTFSDWWAYKYEVKDAMSYNGALMNNRGLVVSFNSDDAELGRRLNVEAAKSIVHGNMSAEDAWKTVTINPAKQLQVEKYTGSLKEGKDADILIWSGNPLSTYSKVESVWIDGINYFNLKDDMAKRKAIKAEKIALIKKAKSDKSSKKGKKPMKKMKNYHKCTELHDFSLNNGGLHE